MIRKVIYDHNGTEQSWSIGERFVSDDFVGEITMISSTDLPFDGVNLWIENHVVMTIMVSDVKRLYWMKTE